MRRPKMFGLPLALLLVAMFGVCQAQGTFEDAETSNDDTSINAHQHFDLRHTIPGEPEVDYPIYSEVPETSFECAGRHEGYYADMETRCQAFRICAHTARSVHGFGFLCPNGTLFSQKNFVCDWYRNVNCAESEQYYSKNNANRIGSSYDMMEKVRQMMEYPMKTISRALQNKGDSVVNHPIAPQVSHHTLKKQLELAEGGTDVSETDEETQSSRDSSQRAYLARKQAVTRAQVESVSKSQQSAHLEDTVTQQRKRLQQQRQQQRTETEIETTKVTKVQSVGTGNTHDEDVYVNSLGELSSDPGVNFMHDSARIIAESPSRTYKYEKNANFAERVNVGLNNLADGTAAGDVIAPDYVKHLRTADEDTILAANINNLLEEVSADVDTSISGYQVPAPTRNKTSFRFLSRGFSSQSDRSKRPPYEYAKPKQTASTIRFSNFRSQQQQLSRPPAAYHTTPAAVGRSLALDSNARAVSNFAVLQSYNKLPPQATAQLTSTQRQPQQSQQQLLQPQPQPHRQPPTSPAPSIVIARAEGQRIAPSSLTSIISALATQPPPKTTPSTPYVALDDFLTKKFAQTGQGFTKTNAAAATTKLTNINYNNQLQQYKATQSQQQQKNIQPLYHRVAPQPLQPQKERQPTFSEQFQQQQQQQLLHQQQQLRQLQQNQQQLLQQQQNQQQQYAQQQLKEQQYQQQFTKAIATKVNSIQQQQQFNGNTLYQATYQQQAKSLQQPTVFSQQQNQQNQPHTQQKQNYLQPTSAQNPQQQLISNQLFYPQKQQQQTSLITSNFFSNFKQNQQQQQPQFPPFFTSASGTRPQQQLAFNELSNNIVPPEHDKHFNVQLPALTAGLIPAPTLTAQRRMDVVDVAESESASIFHDHTTGAGGAYNGVSSYDVPLSSIGRLPNDITHFLRRLRKVK